MGWIRFRFAVNTGSGCCGYKRSFPVHRIYCVGQNYEKHVREMGANLEREARFFQQTRRCSLH